MENLTTPSGTVVKDCLKVKQGERVLVITDKVKMKIGKAIFAEAEKLSKNSELVVIPVGKVSGEEPPAEVAEQMKKSEVVIAPTDKSLTHTNATTEARKTGTRVATLPGITEDTFVRLMSADFKVIAKVAADLKNQLKNADKVEITTPSGTNLKFSVKGREFIGDTGLIESGEVGNLPAGELFCAPVEGTGEGVLVIDSFRNEGVVFAPRGTEIQICNGEAITISNECELKKNFEEIKNSNVIAEFGIGLNEMAKLVGNILEDEKVKGTVHIAFGNNTSFGGENRSEFHMDTICEEPTFSVDGKLFMRQGKFVR